MTDLKNFPKPDSRSDYNEKYFNRTKPMNANEIAIFKSSIIHVLKSVDYPNFVNDNAVRLLLGTAAKESSFKYQYQLGNGPARSYFQIEPASAIDVINNYIGYRKALHEYYRDITDGKKLNIDNIGDELVSNFNLAVFICRCLYYRQAGVKLPSDKLLPVETLAQYWKTYYNTEKGKGKTEEFVQTWAQFKLGNI